MIYMNFPFQSLGAKMIFYPLHKSLFHCTLSTHPQAAIEPRIAVSNWFVKSQIMDAWRCKYSADSIQETTKYSVWSRPRMEQTRRHVYYHIIIIFQKCKFSMVVLVNAIYEVKGRLQSPWQSTSWTQIFLEVAFEQGIRQTV